MGAFIVLPKLLPQLADFLEHCWLKEITRSIAWTVFEPRVVAWFYIQVGKGEAGKALAGHSFGYRHHMELTES